MPVYKRVHANTTAYVTVTFFDQNGAASQPSTATYEIWEAGSTAAVKGVTSLISTGGIGVITLASSDNVLPGRDTAQRTVYVRGIYTSPAGEARGYYTYEIEP